MTYYHVASIVLVNSEGKLIFQKRDDKPSIRNPNAVTAWGGACEDGETPLQAALREVREETNLRPEEGDLEFFGDYTRDYQIDDKQVVYHAYLLRNVNEAKLKVYEGQGYVVVDPENYPDDPLHPPFTRELVAHYRSTSTTGR